ncbi:MAG: hypothetical protein ACPGTO_05795 [Polaribacter sp.]
MKKYFSEESVMGLVELLETIANKVKIKPTHFLLTEIPKTIFY